MREFCSPHLVLRLLASRGRAAALVLRRFLVSLSEATRTLAAMGLCLGPSSRAARGEVGQSTSVQQNSHTKKVRVRSCSRLAAEAALCVIARVR